MMFGRLNQVHMTITREILKYTRHACMQNVCVFSTIHTIMVFSFFLSFLSFLSF